MPQPVDPHPDNVERWEGDNGFSRGFGMTNHAWSFDWFDSHLHLAYSHFPNRLRAEQIQQVMDHYFRLTGLYHSNRAILMDPYLETMRWAKNDPRVSVFWWLQWDQADQLPEIKRRLDEGLIQGLKLHTGDFRSKGQPYTVMGTDAWHDVYSFCDEHRLPICLHLNQHWGDQRYVYGRGAKEFWASAGYTNDELLAYFLEELAVKHRGTPWILAHMNFMGNESLAKLFSEHANIYADTSIGMFLREYDRLMTEEATPYRDFCARFADRLMFGTDAFAYHPLPSDYRGHIRNWWLPHQLFLLQLGLPQDALDKITHGTCEAVLGPYLKATR